MDDDQLLIPNAEEENVESTSTTNERRSGNDSVSAMAIEETLANFLKIGITQIVLGSVSIILGIVIAATWISYTDRDCGSPGIWCGIFAIIAGSLAIALRYFLNTVMVIANLVVSILAVIFGLTLAIISFISSLSTWAITSALVPGSACLFAVAWTVLCLYHAIVVGRILVLDREIVYSCCIQKPYQNYPSMTMAYIPSKSGMQNAFVAVPANPASMPHPV